MTENDPIVFETLETYQGAERTLVTRIPLKVVRSIAVVIITICEDEDSSLLNLAQDMLRDMSDPAFTTTAQMLMYLMEESDDVDIRDLGRRVMSRLSHPKN